MEGNPVPPEYQRRKQQHDDPRADQSQLLTDNRKDEIVVLLRQKQELLAAFAQSQSPQAAGADGDQALPQLIALIHRIIRPGIQPVGHAGGIVADDKQRHIHQPYRRTGGSTYPRPVDAAYQHHGGTGAQNQDGAGKVRLHSHQPADDHQNESVGQNAVVERPHFVLLFGDTVGKVDDHRRLGDL